MERARHAAELARRRYLSVDPDNRLVAATLDGDWNDALRQLSASAEDYERHRSAAATIGDEERARITALATDFPRLWSDPRTPDRERKRMVRLLLDDVTLLKGNDIAVQVRHKGGRTTSLALALPLDHRRSTAPGCTPGRASPAPWARCRSRWDLGGYGLDGGSDGRHDAYKASDAVHGAETYLCASGGVRLSRLADAVWPYNHAGGADIKAVDECGLHAKEPPKPHPSRTSVKRCCSSVLLQKPVSQLRRREASVAARGRRERSM